MAKTIDELASELKALTDALNKNAYATDKLREKDERKLDRFESEAGSLFDRQTSTSKKSWQEKRKEKFVNALKNNDTATANKIMKGTKNANVAGMIAGIAADAGKQIAQLSVKLKELEIKDQKIKLEAAAKSLQVQTALYGNAINKAISTGTSAIIGDIKDNTYGAMNNVLELGKQNMSANFSLAQIEFDKQTDLNINAIQKKVETVGAIADGVGGILSAIPNPITAVAGAVVTLASSIFKAESGKEIMQMNFAKEQMAMLTDFKKNMLDQTQGIVQKFADLTKKTDALLMKLDDNAHIAARSFGFYGGTLDNYVKASAKMNVQMAEIGKTFDDLKQSQEAYISQSGRNVLLNGTEGQQLSSMDMLFNLGNGEAAQLMGAMNIFNTSIEDGSNIMLKMYNTANRMGVSNQKFAKDLQKNLKLAEKYQFKGGVEGMMKMSLWAQKVRFNMDSLSSALEKMHTGNIEDVMQTSAKLNVLGGNAALLSDPMSMLYNAYADPEQYAKNMQQMISGFGHFNKKTGETEFNINEQMRMEAMASAMGISKEEFFNMARQEKKSGQIKKMLGNKYGEDETDLITQHATYDKHSKSWKVNVLGKDGNVEAKDINNLTKEDLDSIFPEEPQKQLVEYTKDIYSLLQKKLVVEKTNESQLMEETQETHRVNTVSQIGLTQKHNETYQQYYADEVNKGFSFATESLAESFEMSVAAMTQKDEEGRTITDKYYDMSLKGIESITKQIPAFQKGLIAVLDDDTMELLNAMAEINPEAALEVNDANLGSQVQMMKNMDEIDYEAALANRFGGSGSDLYEKVKSMDYDTDNMNGAFGRKDDDRMMASIIADYGTYTVLDDDGNYYLVRGGAYLRNDSGNRLKAPSGMGEKMLKSKKVHDFYYSQKHGILDIDPDDDVVGAKEGGSIDRSRRSRLNTPENLNLNINGSLRLDTGRFNIDILELLRNDPKALRELAKEIIIEVSRTTFGGKSQWAPNRYTFGN